MERHFIDISHKLRVNKLCTLSAMLSFELTSFAQKRSACVYICGLIGDVRERREGKHERGGEERQRKNDETVSTSPDLLSA